MTVRRATKSLARAVSWFSHRRPGAAAARALVLVLAVTTASPAIADESAQPEQPRADAPTRWRNRSTNMYVWGIVVTTLSGIGVAAGTGAAATGVMFRTMTPADPAADMLIAGGLATVGANLLGMGIGIPLWVVGAQKVPDTQAATPTVRIGRQSLSVGVGF